ncbi:MAG: tellurium resistance TerZ family protein [Sphingomonas fennica]
MVSLSKGQTVSLEKAGGLSKVAMGLGWDVRRPKGLLGLFGGGGGDIDLDASALVFDREGRLIDQVWFRQLKSRCGCIVHSGDNRTGAGEGDDETITVDLARLSPEVATLMFTVNSFQGDTFERIENASCRLVDVTTGRELARYDLTGAGPHTGQVMARLSGGPAGWTMTAIGTRTSGRTFHDMMDAITASL